MGQSGAGDALPGLAAVGAAVEGGIDVVPRLAGQQVDEITRMAASLDGEQVSRMHRQSRTDAQTRGSRAIPAEAVDTVVKEHPRAEWPRPQMWRGVATSSVWSPWTS